MGVAGQGGGQPDSLRRAWQFIKPGSLDRRVSGRASPQPPMDPDLHPLLHAHAQNPPGCRSSAPPPAWHPPLPQSAAGSQGTLLLLSPCVHGWERRRHEGRAQKKEVGGAEHSERGAAHSEPPPTHTRPTHPPRTHARTHTHTLVTHTAIQLAHPHCHPTHRIVLRVARMDEEGLGGGLASSSLGQAAPQRCRHLWAAARRLQEDPRRSAWHDLR